MQCVMFTVFDLGEFTKPAELPNPGCRYATDASPNDEVLRGSAWQSCHGRVCSSGKASKHPRLLLDSVRPRIRDRVYDAHRHSSCVPVIRE